MDFFKKIIIISLVSFVIIFLFGSFASAQGLRDVGGYLYEAGQKAPGIRGLDINAQNIITFIVGLVGSIFFILMVYAGILWIAAAGQEDQVTKARKIIIDSVIGLMISLSAYGITIFVSGRLGSTIQASPPGSCGEQGGECNVASFCRERSYFTQEETKAIDCKEDKVCCIYKESAGPAGDYKCKAMGGECNKSGVGKWDCPSGKEKIGNCDAPGSDLYNYCCRTIK